ncbi:NUDIX domain-containing protein [Streptomyces sp. AC563]|uniref:NUDIX hydrolase n=1 Tax=Streptomyces buecherae TaxID=2763006 RepID=UPI00164DEA61|nr:NUDIX domain-containing protein [Streptomyces buecherae]MBC3987667.1 NUDIX domain-containing protein [Streptomyces buecherae]
MIVWLNGTFGVGKTSTAREVCELLPDSTFFDPELIGGGLRAMLPSKRLAEVGDYQDLPSWRRLVVDTAAALLAEVGGVLVTPMTLLRQDYRDEIFGGLASRRIPVQHILLHAEETILRERIEGRALVPDQPEGDASTRKWCLDHLEPYRGALSWLTADAHVIRTDRLTAGQAAELVADAVRDGTGACTMVQTPHPTAETVASGVLLFDEDDRVLLVDPTYKPDWEFPGGVVEPGEPPTRAGVREVAEELGMRLADPLRLLVVDWEPPNPPGYGGLRLLFDGGRLSESQAGELLLPADELRGWRFVTEDEAADLLPPHRWHRLRWALRARERGCPINLEQGLPVT